MSERDQIAQEIKAKHSAHDKTEAEAPVLDTTEEEMNAAVSTALNAFEREEDESEVMPAEEDFDEEDDEPVVAVSVPSDFPDEPQQANEPTTDEFDEEDAPEEGDDILLSEGSGAATAEDEYVLTDEMILDEIHKAPHDQITAETLSNIRAEVISYRQRLIMKSGLTPEEADDLALTKLIKLTNLEDVKWLQEHPDSLSIIVDKENASKLEFSDDERKKMQKVDVIRLKVVEEKEVKTFKIKKINKNKKSSYLDRMDSGLATYSVPLPMTNDFIKFRGAQIIQLAQAVEYEDSTLDDIAARKAALVYNQMITGTRLHKTDPDGKANLSYTDFTNNFLYHDLDMGIFGILCASSVEEMETTLSCGDCGSDYNVKYNMKTLLSTDAMPEKFKDRFEEILSHKTDEEYLQRIHEEDNKTIMVESPITKNVYYISRPTVARAIEVFHRIDQDSPVDTYYSALMIFMEKILLYDASSDEMIPIEDNEIHNMRKVFRELPDEELTLLFDFISPMFYQPQFVLKSKCSVCGQENVTQLSVYNLVFLKARDSSTEIS